MTKRERIESIGSKERKDKRDKYIDTSKKITFDNLWKGRTTVGRGEIKKWGQGDVRIL